MVGSGIYNYINLLNSAASATYTRHQVLLNNLANVSTPDFKRSDIKFEDYLKSQLAENTGSMDQKVAKTDLSKLKATIYVDESDLSYRLDGNNVDIDTESAHLAENQMRYLTLLDSMTQEFSRIRMVLTRS